VEKTASYTMGGVAMVADSADGSAGTLETARRTEQAMRDV
jgi:hypothetical protein